MRFLKYILVSLFIIANLSNYQDAKCDEATSININGKNISDLTTKAESFILDLCNEALKIINTKNISKDDINKKFRDILNSKFKIESIAKFALGPKFKQLNDTLKLEYISYFENMLIKFYSNQFIEFEDAKITINGSSFKEAKKSQLISVVTKVMYKNKTILVDWSLEPSQNSFLVSDVKVDNISMKKVQREEVSGLFKHSKNIEDFINELKSRYSKIDNTIK